METTAEKYSKYIDINLVKKLVPIHQYIDETLTRLDEFQTMLTILQENRCNAIGLTGSLSYTIESFDELKELFKRIDSLEKLIEHAKSNIDEAERKVDAAEEQYGLNDNSFKIKNFIRPLFKKNVKETTSSSTEVEMFSAEDYFYVDEACNK